MRKMDAQIRGKNKGRMKANWESAAVVTINKSMQQNGDINENKQN